MQVRVLGGFSAHGPGGVIHLESAKTEALLTFLALSPGEHLRTTLEGLLWSDLPAERAARNLRHSLWSIRRAFASCGAAVITSDRRHLAFAPNPDVSVDAVALLAIRDAIRRGADPLSAWKAELPFEAFRDLLAGVTIQGAPMFEEWLLCERERLRAAAHEVLSALVAAHRQRGELDESLEKAHQLVDIDPWREDSHRAVMEVLALAGNPGAALAQFEVCRKILANDLQTAPTIETARLAASLQAAIRAGEASDAPFVRHNLPAQTTPFLGREQELGEIERLLSTPTCRLICLLGPGGIGKTRLAIQVGLRQLVPLSSAGAPFEGVWFVPPQENGDTDDLREAVARALLVHIPATPSVADAERRLLDYLRARRALLILDGFEHRLGQAHLLREMLAAAPLLSILVTSRVRLPLDGTWTLDVGGLALPPKGGGGLERSPAYQLFVQTARRTRLDYTPSPREASEIASLCRAVEGFPLAIQLAAAWIGSLPVAQITSEVRRNPAFLGGPNESLRAVFARSWSRLDVVDQVVLATLSVFVGGFTRRAAETVATASPLTLRRLVDSSFLRYETTGRYTIHELLRHYALEELRRDPAALEEAQRKYAEFFAQCLRSVGNRAGDEDERAGLDEIGAELDNVQAAWRWAVSANRYDLIEECLGGLMAYTESRGWTLGAEALLSAAIDHIERPEHPLLCQLLVARGSLRNRKGEYARAETDLLRALALADSSCESRGAAMAQLGACAYYRTQYGEARTRLEQALSTPGALRVAPFSLCILGRVALEQGQNEEAEALFHRAASLAREAGDARSERWATCQLGTMAYFRSDLERAQELFEEALGRARRAGDNVVAKDAVIGLGYCHEERAAFAEARQCYGEALAISRDSGDRRGEVYALILIGETFRRASQSTEAKAHYSEALKLARELNSQYLVSIILSNFAYMAAASGEVAEAASTIREILQSWQQHQSTTVATMAALIAAAEVLYRQGEPRRALRLLGLVRAHPAYRQDHACEAERVLEGIRRSISPAECERQLRQGTRLRLEEEVAALLARSPFASPSPASRSGRGAPVASRGQTQTRKGRRLPVGSSGAPPS
ncbi:MAG: tetratricopeptide repeat protein [Acidobacteriota bacterium]